jgi:hypothetical protein
MNFLAVQQFELLCAWMVYGKKTSFLPNSNKQNNLSSNGISYSHPTSLLIENQKERSAAKKICEQEYER